MIKRIFGAVLVIVGVVFGVFACRALWNADDMGQFMEQAGQAMGHPIASEDWTARWRGNAVGMAILAAGGILAGICFVVRQRYAWVVLSAALASNAVWLSGMRIRDAKHYAFEAGINDIFSTTFLAMVCAWTAWRSREKER